MRVMILVKATPAMEAAELPVSPDPVMMAEMGAYHEALAAAGVLVGFGGLKPSRMGWRITFDGAARAEHEGPFADGGLIAGYTLIDVPSLEDARAWARRYPNPAGPGQRAEIEVRPLFGSGDLA